MPFEQVVFDHFTLLKLTPVVVAPLRLASQDSHGDATMLTVIDDRLVPQP
ncbi:MAG: hypothetical protein ABSC00_05355 [Acidimicrobiales bacterium]